MKGRHEGMSATTTLLRIDSIVMDGTTQCRASLNDEAIGDCTRTDAEEREQETFGCD